MILNVYVCPSPRMGGSPPPPAVNCVVKGGPDGVASDRGWNGTEKVNENNFKKP